MENSAHSMKCIVRADPGGAVAGGGATGAIQTSCTMCHYNRAQLRVHPCGHGLHGGCVRVWCLASCPVCGISSQGVQILGDAPLHAVESDPSSLRHGRWTLEEERYAEALIEEFTAGRLLMRKRTKLVSFLRGILCRTPAGINRKFPGCRSLTYGGYRPLLASQGDLEAALMDAHMRRQQQLQELEGIHLIAALQCQVAAPLDGGDMPRALTREWQMLLVGFFAEVGQAVIDSPSWTEAAQQRRSALESRAPRLTPEAAPRPAAAAAAAPAAQPGAAADVDAADESAGSRSAAASGGTSVQEAEQSGVNDGDGAAAAAPQAGAALRGAAVECKVESVQMDEDAGAASGGELSGAADSAARRQRSGTADAWAFGTAQWHKSEDAHAPVDNANASDDSSADGQPPPQRLRAEDTDPWRQQQRAAPSGGARRLAFDDSLFDQMCGLIYNYKALSVINPNFKEESVLPLVLQVMSACSEDTAMWLIDLERDGLIRAVTDGVAALQLRPQDLEGHSMYALRALRAMFHPEDVSAYRQLHLRCQRAVQEVVEEAERTGAAVSPFHTNLQQWLKNVQRMRFRCNPLADGWADMVEAGTAPEDGYDCVKIERIFCTDRFLLISDRVVMRGASSAAPFGPPMATFFTAAWPPAQRTTALRCSRPLSAAAASTTIAAASSSSVSPTSSCGTASSGGGDACWSPAAAAVAGPAPPLLRARAASVGDLGAAAKRGARARAGSEADFSGGSSGGGGQKKRARTVRDASPPRIGAAAADQALLAAAPLAAADLRRPLPCHPLPLPSYCIGAPQGGGGGGGGAGGVGVLPSLLPAAAQVLPWAAAAQGPVLPQSYMHMQQQQQHQYLPSMHPFGNSGIGGGGDGAMHVPLVPAAPLHVAQQQQQQQPEALEDDVSMWSRLFEMMEGDDDVAAAAAAKPAAAVAAGAEYAAGFGGAMGADPVLAGTHGGGGMADGGWGAGASVLDTMMGGGGGGAQQQMTSLDGGGGGAALGGGDMDAAILMWQASGRWPIPPPQQQQR